MVSKRFISKFTWISTFSTITTFNIIDTSHIFQYDNMNSNQPQNKTNIGLI